LGLPDYYDYDDTTGPKGGVGGWDMMDYNGGDHNAFSKYLLGWIDPLVIRSGTQKIILPP
jgi:M6 family metalloprotease-like protein